MTVVAFCRSRVVFIILLLLAFQSLSAQLKPKFNASVTAGCAPIVVQFTDVSEGGPTAWQWNLGNGVISHLQNPSTTYFNPGTYSIKLVIRSVSGADSLTKTEWITVYPNPVINFNASALTGCFPLPVQFTDASTTAEGTITSRTWDFGDGTISTSANPAHTYASSSNYSVTLKAINNFGCAQTASKPQYIKISSGTKANFTHTNADPCATPASIPFTNTSTGNGLQFKWLFGDGATSTEKNPTHTYLQKGIYTVTLISISAEGCSDTMRKENAVQVGLIPPVITMPDTICEGQPLQLFAHSGSSPHTATWTFSDGTTATSLNPIKTFATAGVYSAKLVVQFDGCADSVTQQIVVRSKAKPVFTATKTQGCAAPFTTTFTNTTAGATAFEWHFGDGTTSTAAQPQHSYTSAGTYTVTLITFTKNGCSDTLVKKEYIRIIPPVIKVTGLPQNGCVPVSIKPEPAVIFSEPIIGYKWNFGDGTFSTEKQPSHTYTKAGTYTVTLVITTASGCQDSLVLRDAVRAGNKPKLNFSAQPAIVCAGENVSFTDKSEGEIDKWLWQFGDNHSSDEQNPKHIFDGLGKFSVTLIASSNTCADTLKLKDMVTVKPPIAGFAFSNDCDNRYVKTFTDLSIGATSWYWNFGDGTSSTKQNQVHTYAKPGTYKVSLTVTNGNCTNTNWQYVRVIDEKADFTASNAIACKGTAVTFSTTHAQALSIKDWNWNFGDGSSDTTSLKAKHSFTKAGTYTVTLSITDLVGCISTYTQTVTVFGPTAAIEPQVSAVCLSNGTITFKDLSITDGSHAITKKTWNFGDGNKNASLVNIISHTYTTAGEYGVSLQVTDAAGCTDIATASLPVIIAQPIAAFMSADTLTCTNKSVQFTNASAGYDLQYQWTFGDGKSGNEANPVHMYTQTGLYPVALTVTDKFGCRDEVVKKNYIAISLPKASFIVSDSIGTCPPLLVRFTNKSVNYVSLKWNFDDGNTSILPNPSHYYTMPGIYYAKLVVTGPGGCMDSTTQRIEVRGPSGSFAYSPLIGCAPLKTSFTASTVNSTSLVWDFGDGTTLSTTDSIVTHTYINAGTYLPKIIIRDAAGCTVPVLGKDTIKVVGIQAGFTTNKTMICNEGEISFKNTTVSNDLITGYKWNFDETGTATSQHPTYRYTKPGMYKVSLVATTQTGCTDTAFITTAVNVFKGPQIKISGKDTACAPARFAFSGDIQTGDAASLSWNWDLGNGETTLSKTPNPYTYTKEGTYTVKAIATDKNGCTDTATKAITVNPVPKVKASADALVCRGSNATLQATGAASYAWKASADIDCITCPNPVIKPTENARYVVTGTNEFGCQAIDSVAITVQQRFTVKASNNDTICAGRAVSLWANGADKYTWFPSIGLDHTTTAKTKATPMATTLYTVVGRDNNNCFTDSAQVFIKVNPLPTVTIDEKITVAAGEKVDLKATTSADVVSWQWMPGTNLSCTDCPKPTALAKQSTKYSVIVKNEAGCASTDDITVSVICNAGNLFIPNTFSPNGDGNNDRFFPRGTGISQIRSMRIYNRWGEIVFERTNFAANDAASGWDGTFKGQKLTPDVYVYTLEVVCTNNEILPFKGDLTLLR